MDKFSGIAEFVATVELGSFVAAGEHIGMTASGVSKAVRRLEERLGVRLLVRTTRHIGLTRTGVPFYQQCRQLLLGFRDAQSDISRASRRPTGTLRVELPPALGRLYIMPQLSKFVAQYRDFSLQAIFRESYSTSLADLRIDVAIRIGAGTQAGFVSEKIGSTRYITCASPGYLKRFGIPIRPEHLLQHNALAYIASHTGQQRDWSFSFGRTPISIPVTGNISMSNTDGLVQAAIDGHGIVQVLDFVAFPAIRKGLLETVLASWAAREQPILAVYPTSHQALPKVRTFVKFVSQAISPIANVEP